MTPRSRSRWSFGVAVAAHAAAIAWGPQLLRALRTPEPSVAHAPARETEIDLEMTPPVAEVAPVALPAEASPPTTLAPSTPQTPREPPTPAARVASRSTRQDRQDVPTAAPESSSVPLTAAPGASGDPGWTFAAAPRPGASDEPGAGGVGGALGHATAAGVGEVIAEAARKAEARARNPKVYTQHDMELGLVPGGQYATMTRDRVRNSLTPMNGHALLEFSTDRRGLVARVRILDASSDRRAWDEVADALAEDAHNAFPLKIPDDSDGLVITLDVTSVLKTLSGASTNQSAFGKLVGAINDPLGTLVDSKTPPQRLVTAKIVGVTAF